MQEPLRESKCENNTYVTGFCTINPADAQFDLFEALGRNSHDRNCFSETNARMHGTDRHWG